MTHDPLFVYENVNETRLDTVPVRDHPILGDYCKMSQVFINYIK
jgi:hypothetical protein